MSLKCQCDICNGIEGKIKNGKKVTFSVEPLKLKIPNYRNEIYNVYCRINIEHQDDSKMLDKFYEMNKMPELTVDEISDDENLDELLLSKVMDSLVNKQDIKTQSVMLKYKSPNPMICDSCKRELIKLSINYGKLKEYGKI